MLTISTGVHLIIYRQTCAEEPDDPPSWDFNDNCVDENSEGICSLINHFWLVSILMITEHPANQTMVSLWYKHQLNWTNSNVYYGA